MYAINYYRARKPTDTKKFGKCLPFTANEMRFRRIAAQPMSLSNVDISKTMIIDEEYEVKKNEKSELHLYFFFFFFFFFFYLYE